MIARPEPELCSSHSGPRKRVGGGGSLKSGLPWDASFADKSCNHHSAIIEGADTAQADEQDITNFLIRETSDVSRSPCSSVDDGDDDDLAPKR